LRPQDTDLVPTQASFDAVTDALSGVDGWLTLEQAWMLFERARLLPPRGLLVEIGSHHGRSTIALALGAPPGAEIVAIDPFARPERPTRDPRGGAADAGEQDLLEFRANLARAGVAHRVRHIRASSVGALDSVEGVADLLYVDGSHQFSDARDDIRHWGARVRDGGTMLVHDAFSSVGVTLAQVTALFCGSRFKYLGRSRSLAVYRCERMSNASRAWNALRQTAQLAWFARNVVVKAALIARAFPVARALRHEGRDFPY